MNNRLEGDSICKNKSRKKMKYFHSRSRFQENSLISATAKFI